MSIEEKILTFYKNNCELRNNLTDFERGYLKALTDIMTKKKNPMQKIEV